ncbi:MAG: hypothetical protein R2909_08050 [Gemmatimonadales bacterium]
MGQYPNSIHHLVEVIRASPTALARRASRRAEAASRRARLARTSARRAALWADQALLRARDFWLEDFARRAELWAALAVRR